MQVSCTRRRSSSMRNATASWISWPLPFDQNCTGVVECECRKPLGLGGEKHLARGISGHLLPEHTCELTSSVIGCRLQRPPSQTIIEIVRAHAQMSHSLAILFNVSESQRDQSLFVIMIRFSKASVAHARATPALITSSPWRSISSRRLSTPPALVTPSMEPAAKIGS